MGGNVFLKTLNTKYLNLPQTLLESTSFTEYLPHQTQSMVKKKRRGPSEKKNQELKVPNSRLLSNFLSTLFQPNQSRKSTP